MPRRDRRGVSEALGFVFVFAIVVATVAMVYTVGMSGLQDARDVERVNNAERAFDILAENVGDIVVEGAPSRATEVKLSDASIADGDIVTVNVSGTRYGDPGTDFTVTVGPRPVVYDAGTGERLVYVNGAVLRSSGGNRSTVVRDPPMLLSENRTVLTLVSSRFPGGNDVVEGSTTVLVRADAVSTTVPVARSAGRYNVTLNVTSPRAAAWERTLDRRDDVTCTRPRSGKVSCRLAGTEEVYVSRTIVDLAIT